MTLTDKIFIVIGLLVLLPAIIGGMTFLIASFVYWEWASIDLSSWTTWRAILVTVIAGVIGGGATR